MKRTRLTVLPAAVFMALLLFQAAPARAADRYWIAGGTDWWNDAAAWSLTSGGAGGAGQPVSGDRAYLNGPGSGDTLVYYYTDNAPLHLYTLYFDAMGSSMTLWQGYLGYNQSLTVDYEILGNTGGTGTFKQTGGLHTVTNWLTLGNQVNSATGTYYLSGAESTLAAANETIGYAGTGTFNQTGGSNNTVTNTLTLGGSNYGSGGKGAYNLSGTGSTLSAADEYIGAAGTGTFNHNSGSNTVTNTLTIGAGVYSGGTGTYNLRSGSLSAHDEIIGEPGTGTFNHTGGRNTVANALTIGGSYKGLIGNGTYNLSGTVESNLSAKIEYIGYDGSGAFVQTGGRNTVTSTLTLGYNSGGNGSYDLSDGGSLSAGDEYIGNSGTGVFTQTGGGNTVTNRLTLGGGSIYTSIGNGTYNLGVAGSLSAGDEYIGESGTGAFNQTGGTHTVTNGLTLGVISSGDGTYNLSVAESTLSADHENIGSFGKGAFKQTGGRNTVTNDLTVGVNSSGNGTYELSDTGSLSAANELIGASGKGAFTQTGGRNTVTDWLCLGYYSGAGGIGNGTYNLSGTVESNLSADTEFIGFEGSGTFNQTGGRNTVTKTLTLGYSFDANGTYNLGGVAESALSADSEYIGYDGTGAFNQTGGTNTIRYSLAIASHSGSTGTYNLSGGQLTAGNIVNNGAFNQSGGTLQGNLTNNGAFTYSGGIFSSRLINNGTAIFNRDFTAGDGMVHYTVLTIATVRTITLNGSGLDNYGTIALAGGTLNGSGRLTNNFAMQGYGTIGGSGGFINAGFLSLSGTIWLSNTGPNVNRGMINLNGRNLVLQGSTLENTGTVNVSSGITGTGSLTNSYGGTIKGRGSIDTAFTNSGTLAASGGTLTLNGTVTNSTTGRMEAGPSSTVLVTGGLATNNGTISLVGGTFDNNGCTLNNNGQITGYGTITAGYTSPFPATLILGVTNNGTMTFWGSGTGQTNINGGPVTNNNLIGVGIKGQTNQAVQFNSDVASNGTIKVADATVTFAGSFTNTGAYISDPAHNYFNDLTVGPGGYLAGGEGDEFYMYKGFINNSAQNALWSTGESLLGFSGSSHSFSLAGADLGATVAGYTDNFAWGTLSIIEASIILSDGNATSGGAQYVDTILGATLDGGTVTNIAGNGFNIYYLASAQDNGYLNGLTYSLSGGGRLIPVPDPPTIWLMGAGLAGLFGMRRRFMS